MKPYDPKLREASKEFTKICEKYDCMAVNLFVSPTHCEFVNHLHSSWSVIKMEEPNKIIFRSKKEDFKSKKEQHFHTQSSVHAVTSIVEWTRRTNEGWAELLNKLRKHMRILHSVWGEPDSVPGDGK